MKTFLLLLSILFASCSQAQSGDSMKLPVIVKVNMWLSRVDTTATGKFKSTTAILKRRGYCVYVPDTSDTLNAGSVTFYYLDESMDPIDKKKYEVLFDRPIWRQ